MKWDDVFGIFTGIKRGEELTVAKPHPNAGKTVIATRTLDDGRICTNTGVVYKPHEVLRGVTATASAF